MWYRVVRLNIKVDYSCIDSLWMSWISFEINIIRRFEDATLKIISTFHRTIYVRLETGPNKHVWAIEQVLKGQYVGTRLVPGDSEHELWIQYVLRWHGTVNPEHGLRWLRTKADVTPNYELRAWGSGDSVSWTQNMGWGDSVPWAQIIDSGDSETWTLHMGSGDSVSWTQNMGYVDSENGLKLRWLKTWSQVIQSRDSEHGLRWLRAWTQVTQGMGSRDSPLWASPWSPWCVESAGWEHSWSQL